jgi:hypothetical protein
MEVDPLFARMNVPAETDSTTGRMCGPKEVPHRCSVHLAHEPAQSGEQIVRVRRVAPDH